MADLKVRIIGTLNAGASIGEINTSIKAIEKKINKIKLNVTIDDNLSKNIEKLTQQLKGLKVGGSSGLNDITRQMGDVSNRTQQATRSVISFGEQLRTALVRGSIWSATLGSMYGVINGFKEMTNQVVELDTKMTSLRRVMDLPDYKFNELLQESISLGDELSNKIGDIIDLYSGFGRMGYNEDQLTAVSKTAQILQNVSDLTVDDTVNTLTAAMLNFNIAAEDSAQIAD